MSVNKKTIVGFVAAALFLVACGLFAFLRVVSKRPEPVAGEVVPASWAEFRTSTGHRAHVGKSTVVCKDCHGFEAAGFTNPGSGVCARCHAEQASHTHTGGQHPTGCLSCHSFAPRDAPTCLGCHAETQGTHAKVAQHASVDCSNCHHPHATPSITPKDCTSCHDERALAHADHPKSQGCQDCHHAHEPAKTAMQSCGSCHERPAGPKPANHDSCLSCHKPHDFVAQAGRVCVGCHGVKPTLVAATAPVHTRCTSCHTPHAPMLAAFSCQGCHKQVHVVHDGKESCIGCHAPHSGDVNVKASACTSCHTKIAASDHGVHSDHISCTNCHKPHSFPPIPLRSSFETPAGVGLRSVVARGQLCGDCHSSEATHASENRGHEDCRSCHGPSAHQPSQAPPCGSCHGKELATAPVGHQRCTGCHEPHSGQRVPEATTCTGCHVKKTTELHASIQGGCENCHRPHGPNGIAAPPVCTSCHEKPKLPALHALASHTECKQCHTSHAPPRSDRDTCTSTCHVNRRDHQPAAQICTGCHVFRN